MSWTVLTQSGTVKSGEVPPANVAAALVSKSVSQAITTGTIPEVLVTWDQESYDTDSCHNNVTDNSRLTVNTSGYYVVNGVVAFDANSTGVRYLMIRKNSGGSASGGTLLAIETQTATTSPTASAISASLVSDFVSGDYVEMFVYQNSGGNLNLSTNSKFGITRVGSDPSYSSKTQPTVKAYRSAAANLATGTFNVISLDAESFDSGTSTAMHDNVTNNSRLTCRESGTYLVFGQLSIVNFAAGTCGAKIRLNAAGSDGAGTALAEERRPPNNNASNNEVMSVMTTVPLVVGDYVELFGYQSSGGSIALGVGADQTFLGMVKVGETGQGASQLDHLSDVNVSGLANEDIMAYNSGSGAFTNRTRRRFKRYGSADLSVATGTSYTKLTSTFFNTDVYGSTDFWDGTNHRLIVPENGFYRIEFYGAWDAGGTGGRSINMVKNGSGTFVIANVLNSSQVGNAGASFATLVTSLWSGDLTTSDHVEFFVAHTQGVNLNFLGGVNRNWITCEKVW